MPADTTTLDEPPRPRVPMDPRIRQRRIDVRRHEGRRRLRALLLALCLVGLVVVAWGITRSPLLDVDTVEVSGAHHTSPGAVRAALGIRHGQAMLDVDDGAAAARLRSLAWVASAKVRRQWPGTVRVDVHERTAVASARTATGWALVDRTGRVLERIPAARGGLPALEGTPPAPAPGDGLAPAARGALAVAEQIPSERVDQVPVVARLADGTVELRLAPTDGGPPGVVRFGPPDQVGAKLLAVFTMLDRVDVRGLAQIDVRVPSSPVVIRR